MNKFVWGIILLVIVVVIAVTYGQGYLVQQQAALAMAETARLQAQAHLVAIEALEAELRQQRWFDWLSLGVSALMVYAFASQRVVYVPRGKE